MNKKSTSQIRKFESFNFLSKSEMKTIEKIFRLNIINLYYKFDEISSLNSKNLFKLKGFGNTKYSIILDIKEKINITTIFDYIPFSFFTDKENILLDFLIKIKYINGYFEKDDVLNLNAEKLQDLSGFGMFFSSNLLQIQNRLMFVPLSNENNSSLEIDLDTETEKILQYNMMRDEPNIQIDLLKLDISIFEDISYLVLVKKISLPMTNSILKQQLNKSFAHDPNSKHTKVLKKIYSVIQNSNKDLIFKNENNFEFAIERIKQAINLLKDVIKDQKKLYVLNNRIFEKKKTLETIGNELNVTREFIRLIEKKIISKINFLSYADLIVSKKDIIEQLLFNHEKRYYLKNKFNFKMFNDAFSIIEKLFSIKSNELNKLLLDKSYAKKILNDVMNNLPNPINKKVLSDKIIDSGYCIRIDELLFTLKENKEVFEISENEYLILNLNTSTIISSHLYNLKKCEHWLQIISDLKNKSLLTNDIQYQNFKSITSNNIHIIKCKENGYYKHKKFDLKNT